MGSYEVAVLFVVSALIILPADVESKAIMKKRETMIWCSRSTPCGWEVYRPFWRNVEYFIKSPCDCPEDLDCVRIYDDISISAYVHLCRARDEEVIVWPHDNHGSQTVPVPTV
ncbi:uncharacterized protein [Parasteatoda tepidariorum]|uniref:uncharacterized protein n=1 Tax=Parasteatoda tepidariorum TaxID=114398 RepID=UPI00077FD32D|nr:uncharacterized protein LOC107444091 [Parasteatoda tepidariorum]